MPSPDQQEAIDALRGAFRQRRLSLFLGAGVSVASGLPTWDRLVLSIYFATISKQTMDGWRPFPNYLHAIADWYLQRLSEPLEITARKVRSFYEDTAEGRAAFAKAMREAIYGSDAYFYPEGVLSGNSTLRAVADLCDATSDGLGHGVSSVVTYNYDNLLEMGLEGRREVSVVDCATSRIDDGSLPVFHVHGFVSFQPDGEPDDSSSGEVVFTEEEYNLAATDPYAWSNIVQLREMSGNVGVMVGLSLADRNIRRLLDALARSPVKPRIYALLKEPQPTEIGANEIQDIDRAARDMLEKFENSGVKRNLGYDGDSAGYVGETSTSGLRMDYLASHDAPPPMAVKAASNLDREVRGIIRQVERLERKRQEVVMENLGITPIWYQHHDEIEGLLSDIAG